MPVVMAGYAHAAPSLQTTRINYKKGFQRLNNPFLSEILVVMAGTTNCYNNFRHSVFFRGFDPVSRTVCGIPLHGF